LNICQRARAPLELDPSVVRHLQARIRHVSRRVSDPECLRLPVYGLDRAAEFPNLILGSANRPLN
jgi:hypothetical protein